MTNFVFKLLELPENAQKVVLRTLNHSELFIFSTISTKTKNLVQSLQVPALSLIVVVYVGLEFKANFCDGTHLTLVLTDACQLEHPRDLSIKYSTADMKRAETVRCRCLRFGVRQLVRHLKSIFQFALPSKLIFHSCLKTVRVEDVWNNFWDLVDYLDIHVPNQEAIVQKILKTCLSTTTRMNLLGHGSLSGPVSMGHVVLQNLNVLTVNYPLDLDSLLSCNSAIIRPVSVEFCLKTVNRFLKSWTKGSNPRLEFFCFMVNITDDVNIDTILNGVPYRNVSKDATRNVKNDVRKNMIQVPQSRIGEVRGGIRIRNKVGTIATVHHEDRHEAFHVVQMFVWN